MEAAPATGERGLDGYGVLFLILGLGSLANSVWMFVDPMHWYTDLPAGVPDFGPFNPHFVRDIGCAFATAGVALLGAARWPQWRVPLAASATFFFAAHAILHVHDTLRGLVDSHHWWLDLPGVYLPALLLAVATVVLWRREPAG